MKKLIINNKEDFLNLTFEQLPEYFTQIISKDKKLKKLIYSDKKYNKDILILICNQLEEFGLNCGYRETNSYRYYINIESEIRLYIDYDIKYSKIWISRTHIIYNQFKINNIIIKNLEEYDKDLKLIDYINKLIEIRKKIKERTLKKMLKKS